MTKETASIGSDTQYAHGLSRQKLLLIGLGSSAIFGFLGLILMPYLLDQAAFNNPENSSANVNVVEQASMTRSVRFEMNLGFTGLHPFWGFRTHIALSPDGTKLAYIDQEADEGSLYIRDLLNLDSDRVLATYAGSGGSGFLSFSSDGEWVIYLDNNIQKRVRVEGGAAQEIIGSSHNAGGFASEQALFFTARGSGNLMRVSVGGGEAESIANTPGVSYFWPALLPGGTHLLVTAATNPRSVATTGRVVLIDLNSLEETVLIESAFNPKYANTGHITFSRDASVWAVPFDVSKLEITGDQVPIILDVETDQRRGTAVYSFSEDGRLVYLRGGAVGSNSGTYSLVKFGRSGVPVEADLQSQQYGHLSLSPNERQMALTVYDSVDTSDIWIWDLNRDILGRRTFEGDASRSIWGPDGQNLIYTVSDSDLADRNGLWTVSANGSSQPSQLFPINELTWPRSISLDNKLLFSLHSGAVGAYMLDLEEGGVASLERDALLLDLAPNIATNVQMNISPNGNWVAYNSNETGRPEVYVRPFPNVENGKWQASIGGGIGPLWSRDGTEIFYWWRGEQFSVSYSEETPDLDGRPSFLEFERPVTVAQVPIIGGTGIFPSWAYSSDRDEFIAVMDNGAQLGGTVEEILAEQVSLIAIEDWFSELSSMAPENLE